MPCSEIKEALTACAVRASSLVKQSRSLEIGSFQSLSLWVCCTILPLRELPPRSRISRRLRGLLQGCIVPQPTRNKAKNTFPRLICKMRSAPSKPRIQPIRSFFDGKFIAKRKAVLRALQVAAAIIRESSEPPDEAGRDIGRPSAAPPAGSSFCAATSKLPPRSLARGSCKNPAAE